MGQFVAKDIAGQTFGHLKAVKKLSKKDKNTEYSWGCICTCGNFCSAKISSLTRGLKKSCGCVWRNKALLKLKIEQQRREKYSDEIRKSVLYSRWRGMKKRCLSKLYPQRLYYFDKGITVCDEWKNDFLSFKDWSEKNGFNPDLTIDRIDNTKGYFPDNCRWANHFEQCETRSPPGTYKSRPKGVKYKKSK